VVRLKIADIDSGRMLIRVEQGKGGRDRYVMLSPQLLGMLRVYWHKARPAHWLFPGHDESRPLDASVLQWACRTELRISRQPEHAATIWGGARIHRRATSWRRSTGDETASATESRRAIQNGWSTSRFIRATSSLSAET
jgi:integrase